MPRTAQEIFADVLAKWCEAQTSINEEYAAFPKLNLAELQDEADELRDEFANAAGCAYEAFIVAKRPESGMMPALSNSIGCDGGSDLDRKIRTHHFRLHSMQGDAEAIGAHLNAGYAALTGLPGPYRVYRVRVVVEEEEVASERSPEPVSSDPTT